MAGILESVFTTGNNLYCIIRDNTGQVWNGASFEAYNVAHWASYAVSMVEQASSSYYKVNFPAAIPAGKYSFVVHKGSPATAGDPPEDRGFMDWSGSIENILGAVTAKLPDGFISDFDETSELVNLNANQSGVTIGTVNALGASATSTIKTEIDQSVGSDAIPELNAVPSATPTLKVAIMFLFQALRDKRTSDSTTVRIYNSSGAVIASASQSDNGVTFTKENFS